MVFEREEGKSSGGGKKSPLYPSRKAMWEKSGKKSL